LPDEWWFRPAACSQQLAAKEKNTSFRIDMPLQAASCWLIKEFKRIMAQLENVFSWSKSRDEEFRECRRKYYYDRYASWGGWETKAPLLTRQAYVLKNLKNRWAWKGERVHHAIEMVLKHLRAGQSIAMSEAIERLTEQMRTDYRSSKAKKYLENPKKNVGLFEHEYEKPISDETWKKIHAEAAACLKNFCESELYQTLAADDKKSWLLIEDLEEFDSDGARIYVKLDFARKKDDRIEIYDWKTGKSGSEEASVQIGTYAIYAMEKWRVPLSAIRAYLVNVSEGPVFAKEAPVTDGLVEETKAVISESVRAMQGLLTDPAKNIPKPEEDFAFTENERLCDFCNFRKICKKFVNSDSARALD
jgi:hypothetical protein